MCCELVITLVYVIASPHIHCVVAVWRAKQPESRRVKYWKTAPSIFAALSASLVLAEDFKTINGKVVVVGQSTVSWKVIVAGIVVLVVVVLAVVRSRF